MKNKYLNKKSRGLIFNLGVYISAFLIGLIPFYIAEDLLLSELLFTVTATVFIYIISFCISDTSLYDPYWSVTPPIPPAKRGC